MEEKFVKQHIMEHLAPKFEELTGRKLFECDITYDLDRGVIHINPYKSKGGWHFHYMSPCFFWFENIASWTYRSVDFDKIWELMVWWQSEWYDMGSAYIEWRKKEDKESIYEER